MTYRIELSSDEVPKQWYNMLADLPCELPAPKNSSAISPSVYFPADERN